MDRDLLMEGVRAALQREMDRLGETQGAVARKSGLTPAQVSLTLSGKRTPGLRVLHRFAEGLGLDLFQIVAAAQASAGLTLLDEIELPRVESFGGQAAGHVLQRVTAEMGRTDELTPAYDRSWEGNAGWAKHGYLLGWADALSAAERYLARDHLYPNAEPWWEMDQQVDVFDGED